MNQKTFLIESVSVELARNFCRESVFGIVNDRIEIARQVLLAVLSSRIRWEVACRIVDGLFVHLVEALGEQKCSAIDLRYRKRAIRKLVSCHRHPKLAQLWVFDLLCNSDSKFMEVLSLITSDMDVLEIRRSVIQLVKGLGPKQSSLLLRNIGRGKHIAVIDRHILSFMRLLKLIPENTEPSSMRSYECHESAFLSYAAFRRLPPDTLDLAIWVVMRTVRLEKANEHCDLGFGRPRFNSHGRAMCGGEDFSVSSLHKLRAEGIWKGIGGL